MTQYLLIALLALCAFIQQPCGGKYRWEVKVCSDTARISHRAIETSVSSMTTFKPGFKPKANTPRTGIEHNTYTVNCIIREFKREDDGDYHLVICDLIDTTVTMVAEIANPLCETVQKSRYIMNIQRVREHFEFKVKAKGGKVKPGIYKITGPAYFDFYHGQLGMSKNGIEIHPVLSIKRLN